MSGFASALLAPPMIVCSITAGVNGTNTGYKGGLCGAIALTSVYRGAYTISDICDEAGAFTLAMSGALGQAGSVSFVQINGLLFQTSAASFNGFNQWTWTGVPAGLVNLSNYGVVIG